MMQKFQKFKVNILVQTDYNKFTKDIVDNSIKSKILVTKRDFEANLTSFNKTITLYKSKHLLVENELKKAKKFDSSLFIGESYFNNDGAQLSLEKFSEKYFNQFSKLLQHFLVFQR